MPCFGRYFVCGGRYFVYGQNFPSCFLAYFLELQRTFIIQEEKIAPFGYFIYSSSGYPDLHPTPLPSASTHASEATRHQQLVAEGEYMADDAAAAVVVTAAAAETIIHHHQQQQQ